MQWSNASAAGWGGLAALPSLASNRSREFPAGRRLFRRCCARPYRPPHHAGEGRRALRPLCDRSPDSPNGSNGRGRCRSCTRQQCRVAIVAVHTLAPNCGVYRASSLHAHVCLWPWRHGNRPAAPAFEAAKSGRESVVIGKNLPGPMGSASGQDAAAESCSHLPRTVTGTDPVHVLRHNWHDAARHERLRASRLRDEARAIETPAIRPYQLCS